MEREMPYASNRDLPVSVRRHLSAGAQDILRNAFNHAWQAHGSREPDRREDFAHRVAWAAVKTRYHKVGDHWEPREFEGNR
jgi:cation transport regulator